MPITEKQREQRRGHLGSSDVAAILGVDKYRNAYDIFLDKTGKVEADKTENEAMKAGTLFESGVLAHAEEKLGKLIKNQYRSAEGFPIAANIDALVVVSGEPVEAKTAGLFSILPDGWGQAGTDEVPDNVIIQSHVHMLCAIRDICYVAAFLGGKGFNMYPIELDNEIMDIIKDKSIEFWDNYVVKDEPPPDIIPSIELSRRMKREPNKTISISKHIVENWQNAKHTLKVAVAVKDGAESELLVALGNAEAGTCELGTVTYFEQTTKRIDSKRLREEKPEIATDYLKESKFRVARLKKPKNKAGN